jgi:hypothetical protein
MTTMTNEISETQQELDKSFIEEVPHSLLDSGIAYGYRHIQESQYTVEDRIKAPHASWNKAYGYATLSAFHYLDARVEYNGRLTKLFNEWLDAEGNEDEYSNSDESVNRFIESIGGNHDGYMGGSGLTYNEENCLSSDFVYNLFTAENEDGWEQEYVAISIHGGCDIRGGYTDFKFFETGDIDYFFDFASYTTYFTCNYQRPAIEQIQIDMFTGQVAGPIDQCQYYHDNRGGYGEWYNQKGYTMTNPEPNDKDGEDGVTYECPCGKGDMVMDDISGPNQF